MQKEKKQREVGIIRNVEVEIESTLEKLKVSRKEEERKIKGWEKQVAEYVGKLKKYTDDVTVEVPEEVLQGGQLAKAAEDCFVQASLRGAAAGHIRCK